MSWSKAGLLGKMEPSRVLVTLQLVILMIEMLLIISDGSNDQTVHDRDVPRVGPHLSLARWLLTSQFAGLVRYLHPSGQGLPDCQRN